METGILASLTLGFVGSLHCVFMCGPIVLALPSGGAHRGHFVYLRLLNNAGRIVTYAVVGGICGGIGGLVNMAGLQSWLSIVAGLAIFLFYLFPRVLPPNRRPGAVLARLTDRLLAAWRHLMGNPRAGSQFGFGMLNGLLPCGLVYVALALAIVSGSIVGGATSMAAFGFGTVPALMAVALFGQLLPNGARRRISKLIPVAAVGLGVMLVLRGMSLGIPYISPDNSSAPATKTVQECCK